MHNLRGIFPTHFRVSILVTSLWIAAIIIFSSLPFGAQCAQWIENKIPTSPTPMQVFHVHTTALY